MAKAPTEPLEITAHLVDGRIVSTDGLIMFDSIIYHAWFYKYAPHVLRGEGKDSFDGYIGLPLRHLPGNRWAASRAVYIEVEKRVEHYNKRPDFFAADKINYLAESKGIISDSAGAYRAYRNPVVIRIVKDGILKFYCMGHADEIIDLLSRIPAVGKKPSMGWGIVDKWEVKSVDADYSLWHPKHGLMRPVALDESAQYPDLDLSDYPILNYGVKPPYWKQKNFRTCYVPITR